MAQGVYTGTDRRRSVRFPFKAEVKIEHAGGAIEARGINFNDDAISVEHDAALDVGTAVTVFVVDELGNDITMHGDVARAEGADQGRYLIVIRRTDPAGSGEG
jgi:hypothetical protein